jgi:hypothetical protein
MAELLRDGSAASEQINAFIAVGRATLAVSDALLSSGEAKCTCLA